MVGYFAAVDRALEFMERYRAAFVRGDVVEVLEFYEYPLQLVDVGNRPVSMSAVDADGWRRTVGRIVRAYRQLAVSDASTGAFDVIETLPGAALVRARWTLRDPGGNPIYDFSAAYSLTDLGQGLRIVAITHDEVPKLRAALAR